jgi:RNA polymerase sigma factor (TIGR02999 family)
VEPEGGEVTRLLDEAARGDERARDELFAHVYEQLRRRAHERMGAERAGHTWGTTGLVHEVYLHLMRGEHVLGRGRAYFFGAAARAMHELLRDYARRRRRRPEGHLDPDGGILLGEIARAAESTLRVDLPDLFDALDALRAAGRHGERLFRVVRLRVWGGLTYQEIADELGVAPATAARDWLAAQAWLRRRLRAGETR